MRAMLQMLAAAATLLGAGAFVNLRLAERALARPYDVDYVPSGAVARVIALGHRNLLSDVYWLATVQYIGDAKADERGWDKMFGLVDLVTDLDPRHGYAYQTGGIVLSASGRLEESNRILEKGMEKGPPYWSFPYYLSFNHWFYLGDYERGARYAAIAAKMPGASTNISYLAVALASKSGTPEDAIAILDELRATVRDEITASRLDEQRKLAVLERDAQQLERAAERFRVERGRDPSALGELVAAGYVRVVPDDPFGGRYVWNGGDRKVRSSVNPFRFTPRAGAQTGGFIRPDMRPKEGSAE